MNPVITGQMLIWSLGEITPSEVVEIKYKVTISSGAQAASYVNIASAMGNKKPGTDSVPSNLASSKVPIGQSLSLSASVGGTVLGASIGEVLPATGSNTDYLIIALMLILFGIGIRAAFSSDSEDLASRGRTHEKSN